MAPNLAAARRFIYHNGTLWERLLFAHLFDGAPAASVKTALLAYKNSDNGFGNGLEADVKAPESNSAALDFLLMVLRRTGLEAGVLLDGTTHWVETHRNADGSLWSPQTILDYPIAPWWQEWQGQPAPDAITGTLLVLGQASADLRRSTRTWASRNLTVEQVRATEWLFLCYHAHDYFFAEDEFPEIAAHREATVETILQLAQSAPPEQHYTFFYFASSPTSPVALAADQTLIDRCLHTLETTQHEDGGWRDQHGLPQWCSWVTICNLLALRAYGRLPEESQ